MVSKSSSSRQMGHVASSEDIVALLGLLFYIGNCGSNVVPVGTIYTGSNGNGNDSRLPILNLDSKITQLKTKTCRDATAVGGRRR